MGAGRPVGIWAGSDSDGAEKRWVDRGIGFSDADSQEIDGLLEGGVIKVDDRNSDGFQFLPYAACGLGLLLLWALG